MSKKRKTGMSKSDIDRRIARIIANEFPIIPKQQSIAEELNISQSLVSARLSAWRKNKDNAPLKIVINEPRLTNIEQQIKETYDNLQEVVVLGDIDVYNKLYFDLIGQYASNILVKRITEKIDQNLKKDNSSKKPIIKIAASCGRNVFSTLMYLISDLDNIDVKKIIFSSCICLRSDTLIELNPIYVVSQLINQRSNIEVQNTYHLPYIKDTSLIEIIRQHVLTQERLTLTDTVLESDIVVFGLGTVKNNYSNVGFMRHIGRLGISREFINDICGEIAYCPFNSRGDFLYHDLLQDVFKTKNSLNDFIYDHKLQKAKLEKFFDHNEIPDDYVQFSAMMLSSTFTINFCKIKEEWNKHNKKPFVILVAGGERQNAQALKVILNKFVNDNIIDGLVTSKHIANGLLSANK